MGGRATGQLRLTHRAHPGVARLDPRGWADAHIRDWALLLDLDDPTRIIGQLPRPLLSPTATNKMATSPTSSTRVGHWCTMASYTFPTESRTNRLAARQFQLTIC